MTPIQYNIIRKHTATLISRISEDFNVSIQDAFSIVFNSDTFENLSRAETSLYEDGSLSIYDCLLSELIQGKLPEEY